MRHYVDRRTFLTTSAGFLTLPVIAHLSGCTGNGESESEKEIFPDKKIELLDMALQHEFGAVVQYGNHAGIIAALKRDPDGSIGTDIRKIICQEVEHAILLTDILKKNNVEPTVAVWPPQTAVTAGEMIKKDIDAEIGAIKLYQQILTLDFDDQVKTIIDNIIHSEEAHHHLFTEILHDIG
jgi:rubrerythrin